MPKGETRHWPEEIISPDPSPKGTGRKRQPLVFLPCFEDSKPLLNMWASKLSCGHSTILERESGEMFNLPFLPRDQKSMGLSAHLTLQRVSWCCLGSAKISGPKWPSSPPCLRRDFTTTSPRHVQGEEGENSPALIFKQAFGNLKGLDRAARRDGFLAADTCIDKIDNCFAWGFFCFLLEWCYSKLPLQWGKPCFLIF